MHDCCMPDHRTLRRTNTYTDISPNASTLSCAIDCPKHSPDDTYSRTNRHAHRITDYFTKQRTNESAYPETNAPRDGCSLCF